MRTNDPLSVLLKLESWIARNGWAGYDPYDIKGIPLSIKIAQKSSKSKFFLILREILYEMFYSFPFMSRKLLGIKKQVNPKAMALFGASYLSLYKYTSNSNYLRKGQECMAWLTDNKIDTGNGYGWGYPFDWQSVEFIPANTPNGIVTTAVGDAYWEYYMFTKDKKYLETCTKICELLKNLPIDKIENDQICFSYTPLFVNHIHNLNLFVAEFLLKIGREIQNQEYISLAERAINYTISNQKTDGSFDYNGPPEKPMNLIDNYHTGFVLRMLCSIWLIDHNPLVYNALERGYDFYLNNFFIKKTIPKYTTERKYRLDIHSCAETILCISVLSQIFHKGTDTVSNVYKWTVENMQDREGFFYYGILKSRFTGIRIKSKIPYIRWGQAWMLRALTVYASLFYAR